MSRKRKSPPAATGGAQDRDCLAAVPSENIRPLLNRQGDLKALRNQIFDFIRANPGAAFRDIEAIPGCCGDKTFMYSRNVALWAGLSAAAGAALGDLLRRGLVEIRGPDLYAYTKRRPGEARVRFVALPPWPVTLERDAALGSVHWFPATLHAGNGWAARADESRRQ